MVKYTDDKITVTGIDLYRLEESSLIGKNVYAAKSASIGVGVSIGNGVCIGDMARIGAWASIGNEARIGDRASYDIMLIGPGGSRNSYTTIWRHKDGHLRVTAGCFIGTLDELAAAAKKTHGDNQHGKYYLAMIEFVKASMGEYKQVDDVQN